MIILRMAAIAILLAAVCAAAPINVALSSFGGVASQSSNYPGGPASNANDGNTNGNWDFSLLNNSVSHTNSELNAWWQVDFSAPSLIDTIIVYNRTDQPAIVNPRLNPFSVFLYDSTNAIVWSATGNTMVLPATTASFAVNGVLASSLRVQLDGANYLHLAEVEALTRDEASAVPEPAPYLLMAGGLGLLGMLRRRKG